LFLLINILSSNVLLSKGVYFALVVFINFENEVAGLFIYKNSIYFVFEKLIEKLIICRLFASASFKELVQAFFLGLD